MSVVKASVQQLVNLGITKPSEIQAELKKQGFNLSYPSLLRYISACSPGSTSQGNSITEKDYELNPEVVKLNSRLADLTSEYNKADNVLDKVRINSELNATQESKLRMIKTLKESDAINSKGEIKKINVIFGEPSVIDVKKLKKEAKKNE